MAPVAKMRGRDVLIAALIAVKFIVFQVGAEGGTDEQRT